MFENILIVCLGNICRSPTGEFALKAQLPAKNISSAGISAVIHSDGTGHDMDATARQVAEGNGLTCAKHEARQLNRDLIRAHDLILVMEQHQRNYIAERYPEALSKTMLLGQWLAPGGQDIPDPFRKSEEVYQHVYHQIINACTEWTKRL